MRTRRRTPARIELPDGTVMQRLRVRPEHLGYADTFYEEAECRGVDPEMWYNTQPEDEVFRTCERCPVQDACLALSLAAGESYGVWGGLTVDERREHKRRLYKAGIFKRWGMNVRLRSLAALQAYALSVVTLGSAEAMKVIDDALEAADATFFAKLEQTTPAR